MGKVKEILHVNVGCWPNDFLTLEGKKLDK